MRGWPLPIFLLLTACVHHEPFAREPLPELQNPDAETIRQRFADTIPSQFVSDDTIIVDIPFHGQVACLGVLKVDRRAGTFEIVGLNQVGIKLFDLVGDSKGTTVRFAIPPLMEHKDALEIAGTDIRRIYFDLVPPPVAKSTIERTDIKYSDGKTIYKLGGNPPMLLEKRDDGFLGANWRVQYFKYTLDSGRLYPRGLVMDNAQYHYRIIVKNRDIEFTEPQ